jgi:hypothetical protein
MTLSARIDDDCKSMRAYFLKLFEVLRQATAEDQTAPMEVHDVDSVESQATYFRFSHFIKPDMLISLYGLLEFWLKELCDAQRRQKNLALGHSDIKGNDDLHAYHKYLTQYAGLDLGAVHSSYLHLQNLRKLRKHLVHHGGHLPDDKKLAQEFSKIGGVSSSFSLITIDDSFIWDTLDHAKQYLVAVARA